MKRKTNLSLELKLAFTSPWGVGMCVTSRVGGG